MRIMNLISNIRFVRSQLNRIAAHKWLIHKIYDRYLWAYLKMSLALTTFNIL